jgi:hypothetical protein
VKRFAIDQRGIVVVQVALMLVVLLGFGAFAIDYGVLCVARAQAQNAADAGALAAATALAFDNMRFPAVAAEPSARAVAAEFPIWQQAPVVEFSACSDPTAATCPSIPDLPVPERRSSFNATVKVYRDQAHANPLPTYLAGLFGVGSQDVRAQATATVAPTNVATCVWPLAIPDDWTDLHMADPAVPLPSLCTDITDPRCKPFSKYKYPGAPSEQLDAPVDFYSAPSSSSLDTTPTGYQIRELVDPMKATGLDPQRFVALLGPDPSNPSVWTPARRSSFAAVRIGDGGFHSNVTACSSQVFHFGDYLQLDTSVTWSQATTGVSDLQGQDSGASWNAALGRMRGGCSVAGTCGSISPGLISSPRLVLVPMFDPNEYDRTRLVGASGCSGGLPCIKIVNFAGFFVDSVSDTEIMGHITTYPGRDIDKTKSFVGYKWAFLRTAVLTR